MIAIAPREYWIKCNYDDALLYCQFVEIEGTVGWRIFDSYEELNLVFPILVGRGYPWVKTCPDWDWVYKYCVPVRDI